MIEPKREQLAATMDHTLLKAVATPGDVDKICDEAKAIGAASVCVNPVYVGRVSANLKGSGVKTCSVVGFPLGANTSETKAFETQRAVQDGAEEIDMVINIGLLKAGEHQAVRQDIQAVVNAAGGRLVKVIIETCYLEDEEKVLACQLAQQAGANYVKTSTGFGTGGATAHDVALMKRTVGDSMKVKASGGMRSYEDVLPILDAGADRLGVSASVQILDGCQ